MKQTAVEWISLGYNYVLWLRIRDEISAEHADKIRAKVLAEAKEMEKEQIKEAYCNGGVNWDEGIDALTYYNETYGDK
jgi:hypothetical protein